MKRILTLVSASLIMATTAMAQVNYDADITAIFGSGNPDTDWNSVQENGFVLAARAKERFVSPVMAHVDDVYTISAVSPQVNRSPYNIELSIQVLSGVLNQADYYLLVDIDPSVGINYQALNIHTSWNDSSFGDASTGNGLGVEGPADPLASIYSVEQLSSNLGFGQFSSVGLVNPADPATRDFMVVAVPVGADPFSNPITNIHIQVVNNGGGQTIQQLIAAIDTTGMNHGDYVNAVKAIAKYLFDGGVINNKEMAGLISTAAKSGIGR